MTETVCRETTLPELSGAFHFTAPTGPMTTARNACELDGRADGLGLDAAQTPLNLYERHGVDGLRGLTGDWSLVIHDNTRAAIVLASDHAGTRPLYYFQSTGSVMWDSSLRRLAARTRQRHLNRSYVAEYLATGFAVDATPYGGIRPVPAGTALVISARGVERKILWMPSADASVKFAREAEYEARFRELFEEAVAVRLQSVHPVSAELSGGLDSSSIVCMADRLIASGRVPASGLVTFSYDAPSSPDRPYMAEVERHCRTARPVHIDIRALPFLTAGPESARPTLAEPRLRELRRRMESEGSTVLLTGQLGDLITGNTADDSIQVADWIRQGQLAAAFREAIAWSRSLHRPVYSVLWNSARTAFGGDAARPEQGNAEDSLTPLSRARARELAVRRATVLNATPGRRNRLLELRRLFGSRFFEAPEPLQGLLYSHPYTHRPLIEFLLGVPPAQLCCPGEPRRLMRRALRGIVPEAVLRRRSKGNYEAMFLTAMRACAAGLGDAPESMLLVQRGFVDGASIGQRLLRLRRGLQCNPGQLRQIILLELWLRQRVAERAIE